MFLPKNLDKNNIPVNPRFSTSIHTLAVLIDGNPSGAPSRKNRILQLFLRNHSFISRKLRNQKRHSVKFRLSVSQFSASISAKKDLIGGNSGGRYSTDNHVLKICRNHSFFLEYTKMEAESIPEFPSTFVRRQTNAACSRENQVPQSFSWNHNFPSDIPKRKFSKLDYAPFHFLSTFSCWQT